ncbi:MAG TPA: type IV secretion system protein TraC, partial [Legionellaceae bacterium]|nr:type IV secretion system protein TraC [Legionellaceae bacterium]
TLNPFTLFDFDGKAEIGEEVIDNFIQIRDLLSIMASPHAPLSNIQNEFLLEAAQNCWKKHANKTCMDNVLDELRLMMQNPELIHDTRLSDLVILLRKFGREGIYGHMFNSDTPFISNHEFIVLEMGEFENNPDLLTIIMFVMIVIIQGQFYHSDKSIKKLCIIDEAWRFLAQGSNPISARFIEQGFRTARKYNGGFGVIFQQLTDLYASIQSQAIASSSDIKFIMRQGNFSEFLQNNPKKFNELQQKLIQAFGAANSQGFSNLMLQYQNSYSFHRYFADPFTRVLFSSNADEFDDIERFTNDGLSLEEAVYKVAQLRYGDELCS